jgi:penicillin-binding protein 1A
MHEELHTHVAGTQFSVHAEYVAEMVRQIMYAQYKEDTYTRGLVVTTTIDSGDQENAYLALRKGVLDYDRRHGYRGPEAHIDLPNNADDQEQAIDDVLTDHPDDGAIISAVVLSASPKQVVAQNVDGDQITVNSDGLKFVANALGPRAKDAERIRPGAVVRLSQDANGVWSILQLPQVEGALISLTPQNGAIRAMIGGFDFNKNKFNHVTQAWRQPGSSFKPFIYSASLEKGLAPASIINDSPLYFPPTSPGGDAWSPKDDDQPQGPMSMRTALQRSKNLVSIRILNFIGVNYARDYVTQRFGFDPDKTPPYLPLALGAGQVTPLQLASAYSVFANGGYRVNPFLINDVTDSRGDVLSKAQPVVAEVSAPRAIDARNAFMMTSLLKSVAQGGTGAGTNVLHRTDLAGKTGTTNDANDGWFAGYQRTLVAVAWMGYDQPKSLGSREFGAQLALPIWVEYMGRALRGVPQYEDPTPPGIVNIGGEIYFDNFTPGNGFVTNIGMDAQEAPGTPVDASGLPSGAVLPQAQPVPPAQTDQERQQILDLFKH